MNYKHVTTWCDNTTVMDEYIRQIEGWKPTKGNDGSVFVSAPAWNDGILKSLSAKYSDEVICAETSFDADWYSTLFRLEYYEGKEILTNVSIRYSHTSLTRSYQVNDEEEKRIIDALTEFFRRVDRATVLPDNKYEIDTNDDKIITVTMDIGDFKVTAQKKSILIDVTDLNKKGVSEVWESAVRDLRDMNALMEELESSPPF